MPKMIKRFVQGANLVALKAFPLQFEAAVERPNEWNQQMGLAGISKIEKTATSKLMRHYCRLGFQRFMKTNYMLLNTTYLRPPLFESK